LFTTLGTDTVTTNLMRPVYTVNPKYRFFLLRRSKIFRFKSFVCVCVCALG